MKYYLICEHKNYLLSLDFRVIYNMTLAYLGSFSKYFIVLFLISISSQYL